VLILFSLIQLGQDVVVSFRGGKFGQWEKGMKNVRPPSFKLGIYCVLKSCSIAAFDSAILQPDCKAAFRRMWQVGPVFRLYDKDMFPTPAADKDKYEVLDDKTGKTVHIPHPVSGIRIWNSETDSYDEVSPVLDGSPEDPAAYWEKLGNELKEQWGDEEFADMTAAP